MLTSLSRSPEDRSFLRLLANARELFASLIFMFLTTISFNKYPSILETQHVFDVSDYLAYAFALELVTKGRSDLKISKLGN